jgi:hypothetical protein
LFVNTAFPKVAVALRNSGKNAVFFLCSCVGKGADKMHVREWLSEEASRPVKVKFCSESSTLHTYNR